MEKKIQELKERIGQADAVIIGAGAGLSTAAGFVYSGDRFNRYFSDFSRRYGFHDMYSGGFYPYATQEEFWAYWSRYIWINRYMDAPKGTYADLLRLVRDKDYFVLTTNVDHCFQKAGFDKKRLFYTQGDYGLFQCSKPCCKKTWDNEAMIRGMILAQGFIIGENNDLTLPDGTVAAMRIPSGTKFVGETCFNYCQKLQELHIPSSVTHVGANVLLSVSNATVYCQAASQPKGWSPKWNSYSLPVVWGCRE